MNDAAFFAALRKRESGVFGTSLRQSQVDGLNIILAACGGRPISHVAYLLATAYHETGATMQPVREAHGKTDQDSINRLDRAWRAGKLGQVRTPYWRPDATGKAWFGRGYVQLTHRDNYVKASALTGVDLVSHPEKAMVPQIAAKILVEGCEAGMFTGARLSQYLPGDYPGARRVVNGTDRAQMIATYARAFETALQAAGYSVRSKAPATPTSPSTGKNRAPDANSIARNPVAWLLSLIGGGLAFWLATIKGQLCAVGWIAWVFATACGT